MVNRWHFMLKAICHLSAQRSSSRRSPWSLRTIHSFVKQKIVSGESDLREHIVRKMRAPKSVPGGTPRSNFHKCWDHADSSVNHSRIPYPKFPLCPFSFARRRVDLLRSIISTSSTFRSSSLHLEISSRTVISCVSHDRPFLKPCWNSTKMLWISQCCLRRLMSISLQQVELSDTGRGAKLQDYKADRLSCELPLYLLNASLERLHQDPRILCR